MKMSSLRRAVHTCYKCDAPCCRKFYIALPGPVPEKDREYFQLHDVAIVQDGDHDVLVIHSPCLALDTRPGVGFRCRIHAQRPDICRRKEYDCRKDQFLNR